MVMRGAEQQNPSTMIITINLPMVNGRSNDVEIAVQDKPTAGMAASLVFSFPRSNKQGVFS
jgi:hypothetical protein